MAKFHEKLLHTSAKTPHMETFQSAIGAVMAHKALAHGNKTPEQVAREIAAQDLIWRVKDTDELIDHLEMALRLAKAQQLRYMAALKHLRKLKKQGKL